MKTQWTVRGGSAKQFESKEELLEHLLAARGVAAHQQQSFFSPEYGKDIHNPYDIPDMEKAVSRVFHAIREGQRIMVHGDYDADGISSTAIMTQTLLDLGAHVFPFLPHRYEEGYGLNGAVIQSMMSEFDLLITVDCGVSNGKEIEMLTVAGKDVIIVDHHEIPEELPSALALIHPRHPKGTYPFGHLCGAGASWKFAQALLRYEESPFHSDADKEKWLLDIVMLGTIADVMPLVGENRAIVKFGREVLMRTKRPGIAALIEHARINPAIASAQDIAFRIIPLMNAAGRIGHPQSALDALLAPTRDRAITAVRELGRLNEIRRSMTKTIMEEAKEQIDETLPFVFVYHKKWPAGIMGLVAGRLASEFGKPAFAVGSAGDVAVGSARAGGNGNILEALESARRRMVKLGGHKAAAGFSITPKKVSSVQKALHEYFNTQKEGAVDTVVRTADALVHEQLVSWEMVRMLESFEPFGEANPTPSFILKNIPLLAVRTVGKASDHLKCTFLIHDREIDGIGFGLGGSAPKLKNRVDAMVHMGVNEFKGRSSLELRLIDIVPAGESVITS